MKNSGEGSAANTAEVRDQQLHKVEDDLYKRNRHPLPSGREFFLYENETVEINGPLSFSEYLQVAKKITSELSLPGIYHSATPEIRRFFQLKLAPYSHEVFAVLFLDVTGCVIRFKKISFGDEETVHIPINRIIQICISLKASSVIIGHNHPSNISEASNKDIHVSSELLKALIGIKIHLIDHLVVSHSGVWSMRDNNQLKIVLKDIDDV